MTSEIQQENGALGEKQLINSEKVKLIAFYLPQFHRITENDTAWGKGFTEWTNVKKAETLFQGHYQPHVPMGGNYYSLDDHETLIRQSELAEKHGIHGFCYYFYWFDGRRLLEKPLQKMLNSGTPDFPYCLCWANENWTRRWDGGSKEVIVEQPYKKVDQLIYDLLPYMNDPRYIRVHGRPLIKIYRPKEIPNFAESVASWRRAAADAGIDFHLSGCHTGDIDSKTLSVLDSLFEFPPNAIHARNIHYQVPASSGFKGKLHDYQAVIATQKFEQELSCPVFRGLMTSWDNTPRRGPEGTVFMNADPDSFRVWLSALIEAAKTKPVDERIILINAWNEWAEGAHLEPDEEYGFSWLEACRNALAGTEKEGDARDRAPAQIWDEKFSHNPNVWLALADAAMERGKGGEALTHLAEIKQDEDNDPLRLTIKAKALIQTKQYERALSVIMQAVDLDIRVPGILLEQGEVLLQLEEWEMAEKVAVAAVSSLDQDDHDSSHLTKWCWRQLARIKAHMELEEEAIDFASRVLSDPVHANDYLFVGHIHARLQKWEETIKAQQAAIALDAELAAAHRSLSVALAKQGMFEGALLSAREFMRLSPNDAEAYTHMGWIHSGLQQWDLALEAHKAALAIDPELLHSWHQCCHISLRLDRQNEASIYTDELVAKFPNDPMGHLLQGRSLIIREEWALAVEALKRALSINPELQEAKRYLINPLLKLQRTQEATGLAIALQPLPEDGISGLLQCAQAYLEVGLLAEAVAVLGKALTREPKNPNVLRLLINTHIRNKRFEECVVHAEVLQQLVEDDASGLMLCAHSFMMAERWTEAVRPLQKAIVIAPEDPSALKMLISTYIRIEDFTEAAERAKVLLPLTGSDLSGLLLCSQAFMRAGLLEKAHPVLQKAVDLEPEHPESLKMLINTLLRMERFTQAAETANALVKLIGADASGLLVCAQAFMKSGRWEDAVPLLHMALHFLPGDPVALKMLINTYIKIEQFEKAAKHAQELLPQVGNDTMGLLICARAMMKDGQWRKAVPILQKALENQQELPEAMEMLVNAFYNLGQIDDALKIAEHLVALKPEIPTRNMLMNKILQFKEKKPEALSACEPSNKQNPSVLEADPAGADCNQKNLQASSKNEVKSTRPAPIRSRTTVYLHIGMHKTGSTAIQHLISRNRLSFSKQGYFVPTAGCPKEEELNRGHHELAWAIHLNQDLMHRWRVFAKEAEQSNHKMILLSSEDFSRLGEKHIAEVKELLSSFDTKILVYIRDQVSTIEAMYRTDVLHYGEMRTISDYAEDEVKSLNCANILRQWEKGFGRDNIICRDYQNDKGVPVDVVSDFCGLLAVRPESFDNLPMPKINHGLPFIAIDVIRALRLMREPLEEVKEFRRWCLTSRTIETMPYTFFSNEEYSSRMADFSKDNHWIKANYFPHRKTPVFPDSRKGQDSCTPTNTDEAVRKAISSINNYFSRKRGNIPGAVRRVLEYHGGYE